MDAFTYRHGLLGACRQRLVLDQVSVYTYNGRKRDDDQRRLQGTVWRLALLALYTSSNWLVPSLEIVGPRMTVSGLTSVALDARRSPTVGRSRCKGTPHSRRLVSTRVGHRTNCCFADTYATIDWNSTVSFKQLWLIVYLISSLETGTITNAFTYQYSMHRPNSADCSSRQLSGFINGSNNNTGNSDSAV